MHPRRRKLIACGIGLFIVGTGGALALTGVGRRQRLLNLRTYGIMHETCVSAQFPLQGNSRVMDAWGNAIEFSNVPGGVMLWSFGRDGLRQYKAPPEHCFVQTWPDD